MSACLQRNLGARASSHALRLGVIVAAVAVSASLLINQLGWSRHVGWILALPLVAASYLIISGLFGVCIVNGLKGAQQPDHGSEVLLDPKDRARMRKRAWLVVSASIVLGSCFAAAFVTHG